MYGVLHLIAIVALSQAPAVVYQSSSGWCSPNIANVGGNVTVYCNGVSPKYLKRLNDELARTKKTVADQIKLAEFYARSYHELVDLLATMPGRTAVIVQVKALISDSDLEEADTVLKEVVRSGQPSLSESAQIFFLDGHIQEMEFKIEAAAELYSRAYGADPDDPRYPLSYGSALRRLGKLEKAREVYDESLQRLRTQTQTKQTLEYVTRLLNASGSLYMEYNDVDEPQIAEAESAFREAYILAQRLYAMDSDAYARLLADTLWRQGNLYKDTRSYKDALAKYSEAADLYRHIDDPDAETELSKLLTLIGDLYAENDQWLEAEMRYQEVLSRLTVHRDPTLSPRDGQIASTLDRIGDVYRKLRKLKLAEDYYLHSRELYHELSSRNPGAYWPAESGVNDDLATLYLGQSEFKKGQVCAENEVAIDRQLVKEHPEVYSGDLAHSLLRLALILKLENGDRQRACALADEAARLPSDWTTKLAARATQCE